MSEKVTSTWKTTFHVTNYFCPFVFQPTEFFSSASSWSKFYTADRKSMCDISIIHPFNKPLNSTAAVSITMSMLFSNAFLTFLIIAFCFFLYLRFSLFSVDRKHSRKVESSVFDYQAKYKVNCSKAGGLIYRVNPADHK